MKTQTDEEVIEMMNGCICCTVRQDLVEVLKKLSKRRDGGLRLDAIIIETTGLADPAPVAQTFFVEKSVSNFCKLDGIVTLIDAKHIEQHLDDEKPEGVENEAVEQVAFADRLLVNKIDLVGEADLERVEKRLRTINKFAPVLRCEKASVDIDQVLNIRAFDLERTLQNDPQFLDTDADHEHDKTVTSVGIDIEGHVDLGAFQDWLMKLLKDDGANMYRMKGILAVNGAKERFVYHAVHMIFSGDFTDPWEENEPRSCKLMFIGKNIDEAALRASFTECLATTENQAKRLKNLRYGVGQAVECRTNKGWEKGVIVELMYRDDSFAPGVFAPYQVQVGDNLIFAPEDDSRCIRKVEA
jgi:G3E family GTPase